MSDGPWTFDESRDAAEKASRAQYAAEQFVKEAAKELAQAEERYRLALAKKIVELHSDGVAWSSTSDLARGDAHVAALKAQRDIAAGVYEAAKQGPWRRKADREDTQRFIDWSARREMAEGYGRTPEPTYEKPIGARRAA